MNCYLLIDFGSTYTKLCLVDIEGKKIISNVSAYTTVETTIVEGYKNGISELKKEVDLNSVNIVDTLACSSAAGGLKIVAIGITPFYTVEASQIAALGAGARILKSYGYFLSDKDIREIEGLKPDIILLSGGAEGGNITYIIKNAEKLLELNIDSPIIVAGNSYANNKIRNILVKSNKEFYITENLLPDVNMINPEPVRELIREIFMSRISYAKGLKDIQKITKNILMPTPTAVLKATELLSKGTDSNKGKGDIMVVDIGGATTDIHSISNPLKDESHFLEGLIEPPIKRTVEGDLGMRYSALSLYEYVGEENFLKYNKTLKNIEKECILRHNNPKLIVKEKKDLEFDTIIAKNCVDVAVKRHSGTIRNSYYAGKEVVVQNGKDMRYIKTVIGTGGVLVNNSNPKGILEMTKAKVDNILCPQNPKFYLDERYIMSAMGTLSIVDKDLAHKILKENIREII